MDTYNSQLIQYLNSLLSPPSNYASKYSFNFSEEIKQVNTYGKLLIFFDGTSLFTNIPFEETINFVVDTIFKSYPNIKLFRNELQKLFKIATSETHTLFSTIKFRVK